MPRINLLYVITKLELGGAQKQLLSLINHLDKERYNLFLFTAYEGLLITEALSISSLNVKRSRCLERSINPIKDILALIEICWFIKKNKIDIVHTHSSKAGVLGRFAARLAKVKIILHTIHGWSFNDYQPVFVRRFFIWLERFTAHFTDKLIVVSNYDKQKGLKNLIGKEHKYHLIRYGIDDAEFNIREQNIREELGINTNTLVVGMISCFKPQKSPQDFIKLAFLVNQAFPDVKFLLVGDGILRKKIEELISKFNLSYRNLNKSNSDSPYPSGKRLDQIGKYSDTTQPFVKRAVRSKIVHERKRVPIWQAQVILTGWRRDIPRILSAIDVFVLTSLWEGLPISVLEAMVMSLPVVVTHTAGVAEVISEGRTGFLVPPRNMKEMSEKLILLLKDKNLRRQIGQSAKDSLDFRFSQDNMVKNTQDLYRSLIKTG